MPIHNLTRIFQPQRVAIIGATSRAGSVGRTVLENLQKSGFHGDIYPINPKHPSVLGHNCYPYVSALPNVPDLAVIATPAETVPLVVRECGEAGVLGLIILSAGFSEVGEIGRRIEVELLQSASAYPHMRIIGPNCLGVMAPSSHLNASFAEGMAKPGRVAFISQSGALCTSILDWSLSEGIGFSYFVSIGNALNVTVGDLIDYLSEDPYTDSIVLYLESVKDSRRFMSAARAFTRTKPIVVYKAGRFLESAKAAASHTGAMAGIDAVYEAAFHRAGMVRVDRAEDMFDCAELLARHRTPAGPRLAIVTNAGGPGVMAADELLSRQGKLALLGPETLEMLNEVLPDHWSRQNPVDVLGDARPDRFAKALELVAADTAVDGILVILTPQAMTDPIATAIRVADLASSIRKPVLAAWMGGRLVEPGRQILNQAGIPTYDSPDRAVRAFMYLVTYRSNREILYETPRQIPLNGSVNVAAAKAEILRALSAGHAELTEVETKSLLNHFGIETTVPRSASSALEATNIAREIGYPVVMKIDSPQISHKTEVQGVTLNLVNDDAVRQEFERMVERAKRLRPRAEIRGVTLQPMQTSADGIELIVGAKRDPVFGMVMMVGAGGITAEVLADRVLELPPLNERLAWRMIDSLRIRPLLHGFRGRRAVNLERLVEVLMRISYLISENQFISELDINPLLATAEGVIALDGRIFLDVTAASAKSQPYSHLAIRPYPDEYVRTAMLKDGTEITLRPIRPEDEPGWHAFVKSCSQRSLWLRFRYLFKETTHEMAARYCFVDYDRSMAIVAEIEQAGQKQIIGVGRLVADADHHDAEYAVLVADAWQGRGLGTVLTAFCLEICNSWGVDQVSVETTTDNKKMANIMRRFQFEQTHSADGEALYRTHLKKLPPADHHDGNGHVLTVADSAQPEVRVVPETLKMRFRPESTA
jgi:acetyltransferase